MRFATPKLQGRKMNSVNAGWNWFRGVGETWLRWCYQVPAATILAVFDRLWEPGGGKQTSVCSQNCQNRTDCSQAKGSHKTSITPAWQLSHVFCNTELAWPSVQAIRNASKNQLGKYQPQQQLCTTASKSDVQHDHQFMQLGCGRCRGCGEEGGGGVPSWQLAIGSCIKMAFSYYKLNW